VRTTTSAPAHSAEPLDKRAAILDAALELFAERTFEGTPVPLIAERAGVAAGTIYRYFENKEALVNALYRRCKGELRDVLADAIATGTTHEERFRLMWRGQWLFAAEHPHALAFLETQHHEAYLDAESHALSGDIEVAAVAYVRAAQADGAIRQAPPEMLIALAFGAFVGMVKQAGPGGLLFDEEAVRASADVMWSALRAEVSETRAAKRKETR
jgi:AcrR family transcriptional regulator